MGKSKSELEARFDRLRPIVKKMLDEGSGPYQIGRKIGLPHSTVQGYIKRIKKESLDKATNYSGITSTSKPPSIGAHFSQQGKNAKAMLTDTRVRSLDDLVEACNIDLSVWECVSFDAKCWEMGRKAKNSDITWDDGVASGHTKDTGKIYVQPLFSIVAKFKLRAEKTAEELADFFKNLLGELKMPTWSHEPLNVGAENTLELMIPDLHVGQYSWGEATRNGDYNVEIACGLLRDSVRGMVAEAGDRIRKIAFPIGNDFFNIDNLNKTTTKGTPQDEDGHWQRSFRIGSHTLIDLIGELSSKYEVDVMVIPGNHDKQRSFYLGEVLAAFFHNNDRVSVDNSPHNRKYRLYGCTLVGYTHGDQESPKDLPMLIAHQEPKLWAKSIYREWHHGHLHHERNNEVGGVKLRHFPALVPPCDWGSGKGYVMSVRQACAIEYSDFGPIRQYNWYPRMANKINKSTR